MTRQNLKTTHIQFPVGNDSFAVIYLVGDITQKSIDKVIRILEMEKDCFPVAEHPEQVSDSGLEGK